jgi:hypothetical protein
VSRALFVFLAAKLTDATPESHAQGSCRYRLSSCLHEPSRPSS